MADTRFLTLAEVTQVLNVSPTQAYSLVRRGDLPAIQIGGRGVWRIEASELEAYIASRYDAARRRDGTGHGPSNPAEDAAG
jgi:excisionase family DNA binding protein